MAAARGSRSVSPLHNQFRRVSLRVFVLLLLQRAAAHERSVSLRLIVSTLRTVKGKL